MIEPVLNLIQYGLIGIACFLFIGWLGFRIPARALKPRIIQISNKKTPLDGSDGTLPSPVLRYLRLLYPEGLPYDEHLVAWGSGRISSHLRVFGDVWLPLNWSLYLKPGLAYLWRVNITWYTRPFLRGGDFYQEGKGTYHMGKDVVESEFINLSQFTVLWLYTIVLTPYIFLSKLDFQWRIVDENTVWLTVPGQQRTCNDFKLTFNPVTGYLQQIETKRAASRDGTLLDFQSNVDYKKSTHKSTEVLPTINNAWESVTFLTLKISNHVYGVDVDQAFGEGI